MPGKFELCISDRVVLMPINLVVATSMIYDLHCAQN